MKRSADTLTTRNVFQSHTLAVIQFNVNYSTVYIPINLLYTYDVVLPINNILKSRCQNLSKDPHRISLEQQNKAFTMGHQILIIRRFKQGKYTNRKTVDVDLRLRTQFTTK